MQTVISFIFVLQPVGSNVIHNASFKKLAACIQNGTKNYVIVCNEKVCGKMLHMLCYPIEIIRMNFSLNCPV